MSIFFLAFLSLGVSLLSSFFSFILQIHWNSSSTSTHGPPSYPIIGCLISFYENRGRLLDWYTDLLSESPTQTIVVQRLGSRRTVVTANPANVEYLLKTNFNNYPKGKPFTEILGDLLGYGIFNVDGELWSTQRKLASHEFSTKSLREFLVTTLEDEVDHRLMPLLEDAAESKKIVDLQEILRRFAFDTISKVSLGTDPCCLDLYRPLPPLFKAFDMASEISAMRSMSPVFWLWKIKRALNLGSEKKLKEAIRLVHDSVAEIIRNKRRILKEDRENKCEGDLLSRFLQAGHDEEVVRDMVISFIMAGRDTTSSAMTWLFWLLSKAPNEKQRIVKEVNSVIGNGEQRLDFENLKEMQFLKACLCESMRLYPPVAWDSKHALNNDILPDGTPIGKGDRVTYFPYGMGRMEELWGKDRLEFKPDRWFDEPGGIEGSTGGLKQVSPYKFSVFQAGPRVCLGKEMALIQMKYVVAKILKRFEFMRACEDQPVFVPLLTGHMAGGFKVMVRKSSGRESQKIKTNQQNVLIRSLMLRKLKGDSSAKDVKGVAASEGSRKRGTERASEGRTSAKRAKSEISSRQKRSNSQASSKDLQSLKVERLRAILKSKLGLSVNGKKVELIARLKRATG